MRTLVFIHRWLGIPFCLLFAMWFATGMVMHFVPFPALTEGERVAGLGPIVPAQVRNSPTAAVLASKLAGVTRVRLWQRPDGPAYLVANASEARSLRAGDLRPAAAVTEQEALAIAQGHARRRGLAADAAGVAELERYDQWTVPNGFDAHRPLYRVALNDPAGTDVYVSSVTGEVVLDTTRYERGWNYAGSVVHWIYPTVLRRVWQAWNQTVWWLSLVALAVAVTGIAVGFGRLKIARGRLATPYRRWHAWHHWLGLVAMTFVLTWIFSGWLSMDHGRLFSEGHVSDAEARQITGTPDWDGVPDLVRAPLPADAREVEWFAFGGHLYRRDRVDFGTQRLYRADAGMDIRRSALQRGEVTQATATLAPGCADAVAVEASDNYAMASLLPEAPVYRTVCGDTWFNIDAASGAILEKLDPSRRAYRWFYTALHTFDLPALLARPELRTVLILSLCALGLVFSVTGVVIGWRRLRLQFWHSARSSRSASPSRSARAAPPRA